MWGNSVAHCTVTFGNIFIPCYRVYGTAPQKYAFHNYLLFLSLWSLNCDTVLRLVGRCGRFGNNMVAPSSSHLPNRQYQPKRLHGGTIQDAKCLTLCGVETSKHLLDVRFSQQITAPSSSVKANRRFGGTYICPIFRIEE